MLVSDFHFELPEAAIAQQPPAQRGSSRMLTLDRKTGAWCDRRFAELPELLREGDVLVLNDSRVIPARLFAQRARPLAKGQPASGRVEVLLTEQGASGEWKALVRPGKKVGVGEKLLFAAGADTAPLLEAEVLARGDHGERLLRFSPVPDFFERLDSLGHMPLPPYIRRSDQPADRDRYQTVFAQPRGSVAAPTAGLHFTPEILTRIAARGVHVCCLTLHVGLGTFQPVRVMAVDQIELHREHYILPEQTASLVNAARREGRRVVAAGTTVVRTLEHCAATSPDGELRPHAGSTKIFIAPSHTFRVVDALLTNFHLPQSTLLMLVAAFSGREHAMAAYRHAVEEGYRFFSYGDCMFIA